MSISLDKFKYGNVLQGALELFGSLGIKLVTPSDCPFNLRRMIAEPSIAVSDVLDKIEDVYFVGTIDDKALHGEDESLSLDDEIIRIDEHYKGMMVFAVDVKDDANITRTDIATLTRALNRMSKAAPVALIARYGDKISFSICERTAYKQGGHTGEKAGRVSILRDIDIENTHRGHIDILEMMRTGGITTFDELYAKWLEVFSSDTLTKRFYQELSNWYALAIDVIRFPNDLSTTDDDQKFNHEGAIRLITRLIFVWFLKQRKLIPAEFFDPQFVGEKLLKEFDPHKPEGLFSESARNSHYYRGILQNLFFATLNCPLTKDGKKELTERRFKDGRSQYNVNNLMRYRDLFRDPDLFVEMCNTVPFLNGGLFDCLDEKGKDGMYYDGFSERQDSIAQLCVPDYLFFSDNIKADLSGFYDDSKQKNVTVRGLIDIFNRYQFTVEENTPLDQEVALDPELLGKVFENLLASFNPETKTTARKQTGSFYTPREIVQYMVDESLVAHLKRVVDPDLEAEYRKLLSYTDEQINLSDQQKKAIMQGLYNCKILDPACGSGAFPMGILQQMVHILTKIDPDNTQWKDMLLDIAISETSDAYRTSSDAERQEAIIDIEKSFNAKINRPDYARKLYLIENCIYGVDIQPIAIQISKLRFFISLVIDQITNDDPADNYGIRPLPNLEAKFVAANSLRSISRAMTLGDTEEVKTLKDELKRLNHKIFGVKSWSTKKRLQAKLSETRQQLVDELIAVGLYSESESSALASWDMFDQNHHADFFDPEWMFGIKDGFDIVIGNPPYISVRTKDFDSTLKPYYKANFQLAVGQYDLYILFIERGRNLLSKHGALCYIVPSRLLSNENFMVARDYLEANIPVQIFVDTKAPFESANVEANIMLCINNHFNEDVKSYIFDLVSKRFSFNTTISRNRIKMMPFHIFPFVYDEMTLNAFSKMQDTAHKTLEEYLDITRGFECGYKDASISSSPSPNKLIKAEAIKPFVLEVNSYLYCLPDFSNTTKFKTLDVFKDTPRLLTKFCSGTIEFAVDYDGYFNTNSVYNCLLKDKSDLLFLLGILNSKCTTFWFNVGFMNIDGIFPHIQKNQLEAIPVPNCQPNIRKKIETISSDILTSLSNGIMPINDIIQLDLLVYHLYGLSYDEVLVVDPQPPFSREDYENFSI